MRNLFLTIFFVLAVSHLAVAEPATEAGCAGSFAATKTKALSPEALARLKTGICAFSASCLAYIGYIVTTAPVNSHFGYIEAGEATSFIVAAQLYLWHQKRNALQQSDSDPE